MEATSKPFDEWCLLEIMGHQKYAGRVSEAVIAGQAFIRIDVPEVRTCDGVVRASAFSKLFGPSSVYSITPIAEDVARAMAVQLQQSPINVYDLPDAWREKLRAPRQLGLPMQDEDSDDDVGDDEDIPY